MASPVTPPTTPPVVSPEFANTLDQDRGEPALGAYRRTGRGDDRRFNEMSRVLTAREVLIFAGVPLVEVVAVLVAVMYAMS